MPGCVGSVSWAAVTVSVKQLMAFHSPETKERSDDQL